MIPRVLGAQKDPKDDRDYPIRGFLRPEVIKLPSKVDLSEEMTPVRDQGTEGSCVSFATTAAKEYDEGMTEEYLSPRFLTDRIQLNYDSGAFPRDAMETLLKEGVCTELCQPYIARVKTPPCLRSVKSAAPNKIRAYARLNTVQEMKQYLFERGAFLASFQVTQNWFDAYKGQVLPQGSIVGGHAVCIVGYDDETNCIKFKNSWGTGWGDNGYGYLPYVCISSYLMDAWSMVDVPEIEEEKDIPEPTPGPDIPKPQPDGNWFIKLLRSILRLFRIGGK